MNQRLSAIEAKVDKLDDLSSIKATLEALMKIATSDDVNENQAALKKSTETVSSTNITLVGTTAAANNKLISLCIAHKEGQILKEGLTNSAK